jgi:hypothetical protein
MTQQRTQARTPSYTAPPGPDQLWRLREAVDPAGGAELRDLDVVRVQEVDDDGLAERASDDEESARSRR